MVRVSPQSYNISFRMSLQILTLPSSMVHRCTDNDSAMNDRHFAALCRARIESFAKGAEKYASDTNLSKRVEKWQSKVKPMLENEERRPVFDIHAYSQRILSSMEQDLENQRVANDNENMNGDVIQVPQKGNPRVDFATVTQDCEQYDVCRMFLATLSLCNAGNIDLQQIDSKPHVSSTADGRPRLGTLRMELLKNDISQPMDTYLDFGN
jgi:condensin-2 complex subunit H2